MVQIASNATLDDVVGKIAELASAIAGGDRELSVGITHAEQFVAIPNQSAWTFIKSLEFGRYSTSNTRRHLIQLGFFNALEPTVDPATRQLAIDQFAKWLSNVAPKAAQSFNKFLNQGFTGRYHLYLPQSSSAPGQTLEIRSSSDESTEIGRFFRADRQLWISDEVIASYALALKTKPFVILTGISGTGKTKMAQVFAEYCCRDEVKATSVQPEDSDEVFYRRVAKAVLDRRFLRVPIGLHEAVKGYMAAGEKVVPVQVGSLPLEKVKLSISKFKDPQRPDMIGISLSASQHAALIKLVKDGDILRVDLLADGIQVTPYVGGETIILDRRWAFVAVRPDWTDNRGLLGYFNPLTGDYLPTELLKLMLRATADPKHPYFVILDEMNLARVEHYFSDFLSCLESRRIGQDGVVVQEGIQLHSLADSLEFTDDDGTEFQIPARMVIPLNLYFTGTVNVDETTYMFSPKVLDRANTIEFNHVDLARYGGIGGDEMVTPFRLASDSNMELAEMQPATKASFDQLADSTMRLLVHLNELLTPSQLHVGYRVANEIAVYLEQARVHVGDNQQTLLTALDLQFLQKVLPKLHGPRAKLAKPLEALLRFFATGDGLLGEDWPAWDVLRPTLRTDSMQRLASGLSEVGIAFPRAGGKVFRMLEVLQEQGYASFVT